MTISDIAQRVVQQIPPEGEKPVYECPVCKDTEMVLYVEDGVEYARPCECQVRKRAKRLMRASGISEEDQGKGFADFQTFKEKSLEQARNTAILYYRSFLKNQGQRVNSIVLCGASGRGKTMLGLCICNNLIKNNIEVKYMAYRFYADDESFVEASVIGEAMDTGDKATNKAMSVAYKYSMYQQMMAIMLFLLLAQ